MKVGIAACLHGDETFGLEVLRHLPADESFVCVVGNPRAISRRSRSVHDDLNRCFAGTKYKYESQQVYNILKALRSVDCVVDIHNTTTAVKNALIVASLDNSVKQLINLHPGRHVIVMPPKFAGRSLIGQFADRAVSIEYSFAYAKGPEALEEVVHFVESLKKGVPVKPRQREVYFVEDTIPLNTKLSNTQESYAYIPQLNGYGFLVGEKAYSGKHQGFLAPRKETILV